MTINEAIEELNANGRRNEKEFRLFLASEGYRKLPASGMSEKFEGAEGTVTLYFRNGSLSAFLISRAGEEARQQVRDNRAKSERVREREEGASK